MEDMRAVLREYVTRQLSAAPESVAKGELIEELAENLFCRYEDFVAAGAEPEEAGKKAMDALGDAGELVEYLKSLEPDQPLPQLLTDPDKEDGGQMDELLRNVEEIIKGAVNKARNVWEEARETVTEAGVFDRKRKGEDPVDAEFTAREDELEDMEDELEDLEDELEDELDELEEKLDELEDAISRAEDELTELEDALTALEDVSERVDVQSAINDLKEKIAAKKAEIEGLERERDEIDDRIGLLEEGSGGHSTRIKVDVDGTKIKMVLKDAMEAAKEAVKAAGCTLKNLDLNLDLSGEKQDGSCDDTGTALVPGDPVEAVALRAIDAKSVGGDITVRMSQAPEGDVLVGGDIDKLEVFRSEDGVLTIRPVKTAGSSFLFGRGVFSSVESAEIVLDLPCRSWELLKIATTNGDISVTGGAAVDRVELTTVSGDGEVSLPHCADVRCRTTNGDLKWLGDVSRLDLASVSGDLEFRGCADRLTARTTSGDVDARGGICGATFRSVSGDLKLVTSVQPDLLEGGTTSGDLDLTIPGDAPFTAKFRSTSGEFRSDFFSGVMGGRNSVFTYQGGGQREYTFNSISGDLRLRKQ